MRVNAADALDLLGRDLLEDLPGDTGHQRPPRHDHPLRYDAPGGDDALRPDLAGRQDGRAHADQAPGPDPPAVQDRPVAGHDAFLDVVRHAEVGVDDDAVLEV